MHPDSAGAILRETFEALEIEGASTHRSRRTVLTRMSNLGTPLPVTQEISGHESLAALQEYLEVSDEQLEQAIAALSL
ncbi:MAG TPA: tyrosine-type recombinase/integrase [Allocoleopsis sp.]